MKKKVFYVTMAAIFAATSCTNELPNEQPADVINIVASISSQTRAPQLTNDGSGSFSQGDKMSLFLKETDGESHAVDFEYGSGILTWGSLGLSGSNAQISLPKFLWLHAIRNRKIYRTERSNSILSQLRKRICFLPLHNL